MRRATGAAGLRRISGTRRRGPGAGRPRGDARARTRVGVRCRSRAGQPSTDRCVGVRAPGPAAYAWGLRGPVVFSRPAGRGRAVVRSWEWPAARAGAQPVVAPCPWTCPPAGRRRRERAGRGPPTRAVRRGRRPAGRGQASRGVGRPDHTLARKAWAVLVRLCAVEPVASGPGPASPQVTGAPAHQCHLRAPVRAEPAPLVALTGGR